MNAFQHRELISPSQYLADEATAATRREYVGGVIYAMSGASIRHNRIATNLLTSLGGRLKGKRCEPFNSDMKVRIQLPTHVRFYYPDAMVVCRSNPEDDSFQDSPAVVFEVLSAGTRRVDEGEKREAYLTIPSLHAYVLVEQEVAALVVYRRTEQGFVREVVDGPDAQLLLPELDLELPLEELYERVSFEPEAEQID